MNLGQAFGIDKLRIWQLEDELEARGGRMASKNRNVGLGASHEAVHDVPTFIAEGKREQCLPPVGRGTNRGIGRRVFDALPEHPPGETISEIAAYLGDVKANTVSAFLCQLDGVLRTGAPRHYRYYRKASDGETDG